MGILYRQHKIFIQHCYLHVPNHKFNHLLFKFNLNSLSKPRKKHEIFRNKPFRPLYDAVFIDPLAAFNAIPASDDCAGILGPRWGEIFDPVLTP